MPRQLALAVSVLLLASGCSKIKATLGMAPAPVASPAPAASASPKSVPVPDGYSRVRVAGVTRLSHGGDAVLLVEEGKRRAVPIFIGGTEALSIQLRLKKQPFNRPLTHDLLDSSIQKLGGKVESVRVDKIESNVFHGTLVLKNGSQQIELDARPSDAIAIAIGNEAPIHVARKVLEHAGLDLDQAEDADAGADDERPPPVTL